MSGTIDDKRLLRKVKDRTLLLATDFRHGDDALDKTAAVIGLAAIESARTGHRVTL